MRASAKGHVTGAAEAELQELQTKLEAQSKEREEAAQILKSTLYCDLFEYALGH